MKCRSCNHEWIKRVSKPKRCPECKEPLNRMRAKRKEKIYVKSNDGEPEYASWAKVKGGKRVEIVDGR